jgi:hypothetical protein
MKDHGFHMETRGYKSEIYIDFEVIWSIARNMIKNDDRVSRISIYHTADYEDYKTRLITTLVKK